MRLAATRLSAVSYGRGGFPRPKIPFNSRIVYAGDSITADASSSLTNPALFPRGFAMWAQMHSGHRAFHGYRSNQGVGGNTSTQLLARFNDILTELQLAPSGQRLCHILIGTNDLGAISSTTTISNIGSMISQLRGIGSRIILMKILPRGTVASPMNATSLANWEAVNAWIATQTASDITVLDLEPIVGNMDANHTINTTYAPDSLHPGPLGAFLIGEVVGAAINNIVNDGDILPTSASDPLNALSGANPFLTGTTGTLSGGMTGTAPTGWTATGSFSGATTVRTMAASVLTHPQGYGQFAQLSFDFDYTGSNRVVRFSRSSGTITGFNLGDTVEVLSEVQWNSPLTNIRSITFTLQSQNLISMGSSISDTVLAPKAFNGIVRSKPFILTSNLTSSNIWLEAILSEAGASTFTANGTMRWGRCCLRKTIQ